MTGFGASTRMHSAQHEVTADELREAMASRIEAARAAHHRRFKLRHHAIAAMPIPGRDKRSLYETLSFERKAAKRRLRAKDQEVASGERSRTPGILEGVLGRTALLAETNGPSDDLPTVRGGR